MMQIERMRRRGLGELGRQNLGEGEVRYCGGYPGISGRYEYGGCFESEEWVEPWERGFKV